MIAKGLVCTCPSHIMRGILHTFWEGMRLIHSFSRHVRVSDTLPHWLLKAENTLLLLLLYPLCNPHFKHMDTFSSHVVSKIHSGMLGSQSACISKWFVAEGTYSWLHSHIIILGAWWWRGIRSNNITDESSLASFGFHVCVCWLK